MHATSPLQTARDNLCSRNCPSRRSPVASSNRCEISLINKKEFALIGSRVSLSECDEDEVVVPDEVVVWYFFCFSRSACPVVTHPVLFDIPRQALAVRP